GSHNGRFGLAGSSRITPVEAAQYMGLCNLLMVTFADRPAPPYDQHLLAMRPLRRVVWSIVGDSSSRRHDQHSDVELVAALARKFPNLAGGIMDDFFLPPEAGRGPARYAVDAVRQFRETLHGAARPLDLWVVVYAHQLGWPVREHLAACDAVTFWTWEAKDLAALEENFLRLEALAPGLRKLLGCYMWDYGAHRAMPLQLLKFQCETGRRWIQEGRLDGLIFLAGNLCDLELETVEWVREWIAGGENT
ncbi:MAG: hypothetical protein ABSE73_04840, partial [Planctomycetota bacterium]